MDNSAKQIIFVPSFFHFSFFLSLSLSKLKLSLSKELEIKWCYRLEKYHHYSDLNGGGGGVSGKVGGWRLRVRLGWELY